MPSNNRRKFLRNLMLSGAAFAGGFGVSHFRNPDNRAVILGEEWRNTKKINTADLVGLRPDSEVLAAAQDQIIQHRKSNFSLQLKGKNGESLAEKAIELELIDHGIDWGCSGAGSLILYEQDPIHQLRSEYFARLFNCTTAKCYWNERWHQPIEKKEGIRIYDLLEDEIAWANELGIRVKGHPLVWTVEKAIPTWVFRYPYEKQVQLLEAHVKSLIEVGGDRVQLWDLCNEMLWEPAFKNIAKRHWPHLDPIPELADYIVPALEWARAVNPNAIYSLNDYGLVNTYRPEVSAKDQRDRYLQLVEALRERGAVPDAIGCQTHVGGKFALDAFQRTLDHLAQAGLPLQITEFWAKEKEFSGIEDPEEREEALAKYVCDMYTLSFAHPQVNHVTYWGSRLFFTEKGEPTWLYNRLYDLIHKTWTTRLTTETDEEGRLSFSGFSGIYRVRHASYPEWQGQVDFIEAESGVVTI